MRTQEDIDKLFAEFERIEEEKNRNIEGTGLGMSIALQLLNLMDSKLSVESEYGKGSRFSFTLRRKVVLEEPVGDMTERIRANDVEKYKVSFVAPKARVLVVDDNAVNRKVFRNLLKQTRVQIMECASGRECLDVIKEQHFDIIFLDHMMPEMDGIETLHHIKNDTENKCKDSYVVALTANAISGAKNMYIKEGFDNYLSKPINSEKLEKMILKVLPEELLVIDEQDEQSEEIYATDENKSILPEIPEVDWAYAKMHIDDEEILLDSMKDFYKAMKAEEDYVREKYEEIFADSETINEETLNLFRIKVHSMKSTSAMLGINGLSGIAKMLEFAARDGKIEIIKNATEAFLYEWDRHRNILSGYFDTKTESDVEKISMDASVVIAYLSMLDIAIQEMDIGKADEIVENLEKINFEGEIQDIFEDLKDAVLNLDADEVKKYSGAMIDVCKAKNA